jgi:phosphatidylserine/phosphatidylglycerophosphate/cardiolipin synthase-like enzyme
VVWLELINGATTSLDLAEFYISVAPSGEDRLAPVIAAIEKAAARGVVVRLLADDVFAKKYPETLDRLAAHPGITVRRIDVKAQTGGVMHAKYFVVDHAVAYLGSQNFDYRSLAHIHEIGVRVRDPATVQGLSRVFARDFAFAGGEALREEPPTRYPPTAIHFAASPQASLPEAIAWDLPLLIEWLDQATSSIDVQVLTYKVKERNGAPFRELDEALKRAGQRGVKVRLVVSSWAEKERALRSLNGSPNVTVSVITIPKWSGGELPFARVAHSKYAVIDRARAWVGTSNWEGDYFTKSRNVGVFVDDARFARRLERVFGDVLAAAAPLQTE